MSSSRRLQLALYALIIIIGSGVIGYMLIERWSFIDALFMTIVTITTVGYQEVHPLSEGGKIFSIFLMIGGVGGGLYTLSLFIQYLLEGQFGITMGRHKMQTEIAKLKEHFILCGFGRVGQEIARTFREEGVPFVVIESDPDAVAKANDDGYLYIVGDATSDEKLEEARIGTARGLVAAMGDDVDNTYVTLSARGISPDLFIAARARSSGAEVKLTRAGANRVVSPTKIGGRRMAMLALRPAVVDFIDTVTYRRGRELQLENVEIADNCAVCGLDVGTARRDVGATILAMRKKGNRLIANPPDTESIEAGDRLIVIGTKKQLAALEGAFEEVKAGNE
ncbi:potassium channel family protein [Chloroflexota bacterium]